jgi:hypothetical protein
MTFPTLQPEVMDALRSAGATVEIIAAAIKAGGEFCDSPPRQRGRRRQYADARRVSALGDGVTKFVTNSSALRADRGRGCG